MLDKNKKITEKEEKTVLIPVTDLGLFQWPMFHITKDGRTSDNKMSLSDAFQELELEAAQIRHARIGNVALRKKLAAAVHPRKIVYTDTSPDQIS